MFTYLCLSLQLLNGFLNDLRGLGRGLSVFGWVVVFRPFIEHPLSEFCWLDRYQSDVRNFTNAAVAREESRLGSPQNGKLVELENPEQVVPREFSVLVHMRIIKQHRSSPFEVAFKISS